VHVRDILVRPVAPPEEGRYKALMGEHHYLGSLPKIGETLWYLASWQEQWIALLSFSAAAWKCAPRDRWIGWSYAHQYNRLKLVVNQSRFCILPDWHLPNLGSHVLALCEKRLCSDWQQRFGHPVLLIETFVDPARFRGTVYKAANWIYAGASRGFRRITTGYANAQSPKMVFLKPLRRDARFLLSQAVLDPSYQTGGTKLMLRASYMYSLPEFFAAIPDPRRTHGRRHRLACVLAIAAGASLAGMRGYKGMADWARSLGQRARARFGCRIENGQRVVPSEGIIRSVLIRVDPVALDRALARWNEVYGTEDRSLAIDGKTMCNAIDDEGHQTHVMGVVGHTSRSLYTQKK
jgi:Druantia protein DruA/DDE_Tnp_1-associated